MKATSHPLIEMVRDAIVPLGMQCFTTDPAFVEALGHAGFDFVMLDTEHAPNDARRMEHLVRAAECSGLMAFVRVSNPRAEPEIRRALEAGASGIFLPMVKCAEDMRSAVEAAFFPPKGERGVCPAARAARFSIGGLEAHIARTNASTLLIPIIEHPAALADIDEICALDDVHAIAFGVGDLSFAMGEGFRMMASDKVQAAYRKVLAAAHRHGVAVVGGPVLGGDPQACRKALDDGISIFAMGLDTLGFRKYCEQLGTAVTSGLQGTTRRRSARAA